MPVISGSVRTFPLVGTFILSSLIWSTPAVSDDLFNLSIEQLMDIEVTSVARKSQKVSDTAAAIYVISQEDIRRSGAATIPELLRMVPGLNVAQIDANKWAITARGFNGRFANKLLVLMDGRVLYTPLFAGVYWNAQDTLLEDVERIEVIRGPGGSLWGTNAVNGVINIITKSATDTQGGLATVSGSNFSGGGALRYGAALGDNINYRVYAKYSDYDNFPIDNNTGGHDQWETARAGFRMDWQASSQDRVTVQGDIYEGDADQTAGTTSPAPPANILVEDTIDRSGGNILVRWQQKTSDRSEWQLQFYYDLAQRQDIVLDQRIETLDLDFSQRFYIGESNEVNWGLGARQIRDELVDSFSVSYDPDNSKTALYSAFAQDAISLSDSLVLTVGSKFEHNNYTGSENQPSVRFLWKATSEHSVWGAVSKAVRTPPRTQTEGQIRYVLPVPFPNTLWVNSGNPEFESEELVASELGYRGKINNNLSVDVSSFYNVYDKLITREGFVSTTYYNKMQGRTFGAETSATWQIFQPWRLYLGYALLQMDLNVDPDSTDSTLVGRTEGSSPRREIKLRSYVDLPKHFEWDSMLYVTDDLPASDVAEYTRLDMRFGWHGVKNIELSFGVNNILDEYHQEFAAQDVLATQVPRTYYIKAGWNF